MQAGIYLHYKEGYYHCLGVGQHSETKEWLVAYVSLSGIHMPGPRLRFRPLEGPEGWNTPARIKVGPEHDEWAMAPRFVYVGDELPAHLLKEEAK
jgi:hypothetical protein